MPHYTVNATLLVPASIQVESDSPEQALEDAAHYSAHCFDFDIYSADVEFNVTPAVEFAR